MLIRLLIFSLLILMLAFFNGCKDDGIYNQYQLINRDWTLINTENLAVTDSFIVQLNLSKCKMSKKNARNENTSCSCEIIDDNDSKYYLSYSLRKGNILKIDNIIDRSYLDNADPVFGTVLSESFGPSGTEKLLNEELIGDWNYFITDEMLELTLEDKKMIFRVSE